MSDQVAIYGLGNMGFPLAKRVAAAFPIQVFDLNPERCANAKRELDAYEIADPADVSNTRFIVLCLPTPVASMTVLKQLKPHLRGDAIIIEMSTVNPQHMLRAAAFLEGTGAELLDASILAGVSQMEAGTASLLLGGESEVIAAAKQVLDTITTKQIVFGGLGAGAAAKVINNAVAHAVMVVIAEAGSMATASGINIEKLIGLLSDAEMGLHRPLTFRYAKRIMEDDYVGGMPLAAARKDSELAISLAQRLGVPLFAIQASHSIYELGAAAGYGDEDYAAIAKLWKAWNKPTVPPRA